MTSGFKREGASCAVLMGAAVASSVLGLGVLHGTAADVARALFFVLVLIVASVLVRSARRASDGGARVLRLVGARRRPRRLASAPFAR